MLVVFVFSIVIAVAVWLMQNIEDVRDSIKILTFFSIIIGLTLCTVFGVYIHSITGVEELKAKQINVISNYKTLATQVNKKAYIKTENDSLIIDVVNMGQSSKATEIYNMWVYNVNEYNLEIAKEKGARKSILSIFWYGILAPLPDIKYIELKTLD